MLLILEIAFTVAAWRKGWRGWALLPLAATFCVVVMVAAAMGAETARGLGVLLDLCCTAVLFVMSRRGPAPQGHQEVFDSPAVAGNAPGCE